MANNTKHEGLLFNISMAVGKESIQGLPGNPGNKTRLGIPLVILDQALRDLLMGYRHKTNNDEADLPPGTMIYIDDMPQFDSLQVSVYFLDYKDKDASDDSK